MYCAAGAMLHLLSLQAVALSMPSADQPLQFEVTFDTGLQSAPYTGRVYVVMSQSPRREPRQALTNWFNPPQTVAVDLKNWKPTEPIRLGEQAMSHPVTLRDIASGEYAVQAIARRSLDHPRPGEGPGDLFSVPQSLALDPLKTGIVRLHLDHVVQKQPFSETERIKLVEVESALLSKFHGRRMNMRAAVILPKDWRSDSDHRYPVLYWIGGFGSDHRFAARLSSFMAAMGAADLADQVLQVVPDPQCYRGHSVFADSANNGPWGRALVEELIPEAERKFHGAQSGAHRYATGISSGGWSCLWLQITYPDAFNGCWAHVPDPVDFRDFQRIDLYESGTSMYVDQSGARRPIARGRGGEVSLWYDDFVKLEQILGPGGQIHAFEAVFSPRGPDGAPVPLFDRATGMVDLKVAKAWEQYDIRLVLERNWSALSSKLRGKLHVYAGEKDNFYLDGAAKLLKESLAKLGSDAEVEIVPGMSHTFHRPKVRSMYEHILNAFDPGTEASGAKSPE
jgi:S-formylglutathione hydrolase FrmB